MDSLLWSVVMQKFTYLLFTAFQIGREPAYHLSTSCVLRLRFFVNKSLMPVKMSVNQAGVMWNYFEKSGDFNNAVSNANVKVKCRLCGELVSYSKKATSNLLTHLQVCETLCYGFLNRP